MDRFCGIKAKLIELAEEAGIWALVELGSQARVQVPADEFSDLDILVVCNNPEAFLYSSDPLSRLGEIKISFTEPTIGGLRERRLLFAGSLDVDLIPVMPEVFSEMVQGQEAREIFARGYQVLWDRMEISKILAEAVESAEKPDGLMAEDEFSNLVQDFWYHTVWAAKKLRRGEFWTAKQCVDGYMKYRLLSIVEQYEKSRYGGAYDVWHNGRMLERWAGDEVLARLPNCFGQYSRNGIAQALKGTAELFGELAAACADKNGFGYPKEAELYARSEYESLLEL